jgi:hypothetical protein
MNTATHFRACVVRRNSKAWAAWADRQLGLAHGLISAPIGPFLLFRDSFINVNHRVTFHWVEENEKSRRGQIPGGIHPRRLTF